MHTTCPHCRNRIEVVEETSLTEVDCPSCEKRFTILGEDDLDAIIKSINAKEKPVIGVVCDECGKTLPPHSERHHRDANDPIHRCPHVERNECPHCVSDNTIVMRHYSKAWFVRCNQCMAGGPPGETESQAIENWNLPSCATLGRLSAGEYSLDFLFEENFSECVKQLEKLYAAGWSAADWSLSRFEEGFVELKRDSEIARVDLASGKMTLRNNTPSQEPE